jgi:hypothetical protein
VRGQHLIGIEPRRDGAAQPQGIPHTLPTSWTHELLQLEEQHEGLCPQICMTHGLHPLLNAAPWTQASWTQLLAPQRP